MNNSPGKAANTTARILARAWLHIIWHCWQDQAPYDPQNHRALQRVLVQQRKAA